MRRRVLHALALVAAALGGTPSPAATNPHGDASIMVGSHVLEPVPACASDVSFASLRTRGFPTAPCVITMGRMDGLVGNLTFFRERLPVMLEDVIHLEPPPHAPPPAAFYFAPSAPMAREHEEAFNTLFHWYPTETERIIGDGGSRGPEKGATTKYYASLPFRSLPGSVRDALLGLGSFAMFNDGRDVDGGELRGGLWLSSPRLEATMHFDSSDNVVTALHGEKRFIVASSADWREVYMFSSLHPAARQSQVVLESRQGERDDGASVGQCDVHTASTYTYDAVAFPGFGRAVGRMRQVTLQPGQALLLPAFYLHAVQGAGDVPTISTNAYLFTESRSTLLSVHRCIRNLGKAVRRSTAYAQAGGARRCCWCLLRAVVGAVIGPGDDDGRGARGIVRDVLTTRWSHFPRDPFFNDAEALFAATVRPAVAVERHTVLDDNSASCGAGPGVSVTAYGPEAEGEAAALVDSLRELRELHEEAFGMLLADAIEALMLQVLRSVDALPGFMMDVVSAGAGAASSGGGGVGEGGSAVV